MSYLVACMFLGICYTLTKRMTKFAKNQIVFWKLQEVEYPCIFKYYLNERWARGVSLTWENSHGVHRKPHWEGKKRDLYDHFDASLARSATLWETLKYKIKYFGWKCKRTINSWCYTAGLLPRTDPWCDES